VASNRPSMRNSRVIGAGRIRKNFRVRGKKILRGKSPRRRSGNTAVGALGFALVERPFWHHLSVDDRATDRAPNDFALSVPACEHPVSSETSHFLGVFPGEPNQQRCRLQNILIRYSCRSLASVLMSPPFVRTHLMTVIDGLRKSAHAASASSAPRMTR
jgi:hypothetical protein